MKKLVVTTPVRHGNGWSISAILYYHGVAKINIRHAFRCTGAEPSESEITEARRCALTAMAKRVAPQPVVNQHHQSWDIRLVKSRANESNTKSNKWKSQ